MRNIRLSRFRMYTFRVLVLCSIIGAAGLATRFFGSKVYAKPVPRNIPSANIDRRLMNKHKRRIISYIEKTLLRNAKWFFKARKMAIAFGYGDFEESCQRTVDFFKHRATARRELMTVGSKRSDMYWINKLYGEIDYECQRSNDENKAILTVMDRYHERVEDIALELFVAALYKLRNELK